jgi:DNA/RNA-binding domain of Phe-tRNA-synthetase-like protein
VFRYHEALLDAFPGVVGGALLADGVRNPAPSPALRAAYRDEQELVRGRLGDTPLSELASLAAWRRAFSAFGVEPTKYRNAAEALLRRLVKQGDIPSLSTLVDIGNLVSIRYGLPVAVFDLARVGEPMTVRFARGDEPFTDLGSGTVELPEPGEVVFVDEAGVVHARRWCWRQSAESATRVDTTRVLVTVEGHHGTALDDIHSATGDLATLLRAHGGAEHIATGTLSRDWPAFPD